MTYIPIIRLLFIFQIFNLVFGAHPSSDKWILKATKGDIKVYTRTTSKSAIKEVRITTKIKGDLDDLLALLNDVPSFQKWVYRCSKSKLLKRVSPNEYYYYNLTDFPFPLSDRDMVIHSKTWTVPYSRVVKTKSEAYTKEDLYKTQSSIVRIKVLEYTWTFTPLGNGVIDIDYEFLSDPAGSIPSWVINMAISKGPIETMESLKKEMKRRYGE